MAEITVQFSNKLNGYDKAQVNQFVKDAGQSVRKGRRGKASGEGS